MLLSYWVIEQEYYSKAIVNGSLYLERTLCPFTLAGVHLFLIDLIVLSASALKSLFGPLATTSVMDPSRSTTKVMSALICPPSPSKSDPSKLLITFCLKALSPPGNSEDWSTVS